MLKRLLGAGLGWTFAGPIGGLLGWWVAGKFDQDRRYQQDFDHHVDHTTPSDFVVCTIILSSCIMKADKTIKRVEVEYVKSFFLKHYESSMVEEMMMFLKDIQEKEYSVEAICQQINQQMSEMEKVQILHFLFGVSMADGEVHQKEMDMMVKIAGYLRINQQIFHSIRNQYEKSDDHLEHSYRILDLTSKATVEEVKKAYRELSLQYHPDKVAHLGEEVKKSAEEKFKIVSEAYQKIRKSKGF